MNETQGKFIKYNDRPRNAIVTQPPGCHLQMLRFSQSNGSRVYVFNQTPRRFSRGGPQSRL